MPQVLTGPDASGVPLVATCHSLPVEIEADQTAVHFLLHSGRCPVYLMGVRLPMIEELEKAARGDAPAFRFQNQGAALLADRLVHGRGDLIVVERDNAQRVIDFALMP